MSRYKNVVRILPVLLVILTWATLCMGQSSPDNQYTETHSVGKQIAEGVSLSIVTGLSALDQELKYSLETKKDTFTYQGNTWPILDVAIDTESQKLGNNKITFVLLMEVDQGTQVIVGTVKNVKVNGKTGGNLAALNNTMYIETEEGTEQVQMVNGELRYVE
jgi:hypothetical protein